MNQPDELHWRIRQLEERLSRLSEASLRINESLDFDDVLQGVLDSARSLTEARYGVIALHGDGGTADDFLSSGFTEDEADRLWTIQGWASHFEYLSGIAAPLRVSDLLGHIESLGLPALRPPVAVSERVSFLASPVLHLGERVGSIYLAEKEGGLEFTQEDEDTLVMFASQAAMVIANARRHREEQRARADLETLIDTSPVGVVVFDALTGTPKSFNREARRIVDSLRSPGQSPEDLLEVVSFRRADGREGSLREYPMAELLSAAETLRAEEVVISVPDGRSLTLLLNATPILSDEGAVESMVVTLQDMADIEEQERMRVEFLATVSHELRTPLTSIMGSVTAITRSGADLDPAVVRQFVRIIGDQAEHMNALVADLLDVARIETGTLPVNPEPAEVAVLVDRARSGFTSAGGKNNLAIDVEPDLPLVMADRRRIVQVLGNLLSNASRNSSESSVIRVSAVRDGVHIAFSVSDEGRGIPAESLPNLFRKFSRGQSEEQAGDTGLGLAICKGIVEAHGGRIWAESDGPGMGARFTFTLPSFEDSGTGTLGGVQPDSTRRERKEEKRVRVLAVDDDPNDLRYIRETLSRSGYDPVVTGEPEEALRLVAEESPELVLLDLMLPGADGIELMKDILDVADLPVIFLSAYGREEVVARAFDMGAADYVVKPFSPTELSARIRATLRRRAISEPAEPYVLGDLVIDYASRSVTLAGRPVHVTPLELGVLAELSANAGRTLTYGRLLERVWGGRAGEDVRPLRTIVGRLRQKLDDDADLPAYIFTEPRVGYWMPEGEKPDGEGRRLTGPAVS
ncbi:MAG: ATP-binding protein [Chloroflexota bacterium]|nr:ATP-binding protein [Chloroflexota bacterium]MDE2940992.1 ATP-binding protein [Chloroflexota bacterium]